MSNRYWDGLVQTRLNRRRLIASTGGAPWVQPSSQPAVAAATAASSSDKGGTTKSASDKLFTPKDTSKQAVSGGTWQRIYPGTVLAANVDPYA